MGNTVSGTITWEKTQLDEEYTTKLIEFARECKIQQSYHYITFMGIDQNKFTVGFSGSKLFFMGKASARRKISRFATRARSLFYGDGIIPTIEV